MTQIAASLFLLLLQAPPEQALLDGLRKALDSGQEAQVRALFARKEDAATLIEMTGRGGVRSVKVKLIPAPPGWGDTRTFWVVFHKRQGIESGHDLVYSTATSPESMLVGREVPETMTGGWAFSRGRFDVVLAPESHTVSVRADMNFGTRSQNRAPVVRLGDTFSVDQAWVDGKAANVLTASDAAVPRPKAGDVLRAGGLVVVWNAAPLDSMSLQYGGNLGDGGAGGGDKLTSKACYLTAWWTPVIARQPYTTATRIDAPEGWVVTSEGTEADSKALGFPEKAAPSGRQVKAYRCDVAISMPKVVGGQYKLAGEAKDGKGRVFRSFQFEPVEPQRAAKDLDLMKRAAAFFEETLGPWPFPGYDCYDADTYYGIESYSYTLLLRQNTTRFVAHEMGHTYFGGVVPNSYTRDCWNESLTQYVESILFSKNADKSLEAGLRSVNVAIPLSKMDRPGVGGSASYYRGAYIMTMLQNEVGLEKVIEGMKRLVKERRGVDTTWPELKHQFEAAADSKLDWFWDQWVEGAQFPNLAITEARLVQNDTKWTTWVTVQQTGTTAPFRLRFNLKASTRTNLNAQQVTLADGSAQYRLDTDFKPDEISVDVFGLSLATTGPSVAPKP